MAVPRSPVWRERLTRLAGGRRDLGPIPVLVGLAVIWAIFWTANPRFLSAVNLTNLMLQIATLVTIAVGVVLVLLVGEIDLSVAAVSGLSAAAMAVLNVKHGVAAPVAIATGLLLGAAVGAVHGFWVTRLRVPSFVVTLAGLVAWRGASLYVLGDTGSLTVDDPGITRLTDSYYPDGVGWAVAVAVLGAGLWSSRRQSRHRVTAGLTPESLVTRMLRALGPGLVVAGAVAVFNSDRGLPLIVVLCVGFVAGFDFLITRTRFGRHALAIGGNPEAARRAGIPVDRVRLTVFLIGSTMAAAGGVLGASRLLAVNQNSGSDDLLLNVIAAAVIGGTSLFGGRGSAWSALLGALVIGSISNGMDLLAVSSSVKFVVTGTVLLLAATVDATARRRVSETRY
ncbi:MAG: sugar ABC transporter permease [Acidimicrobiia bacterium]